MFSLGRSKWFKLHKLDHQPSMIRRFFSVEFIIVGKGKSIKIVPVIRWCWSCFRFVPWMYCDNCRYGYCMRHCEYKYGEFGTIVGKHPVCIKCEES